ncbi:hypothetical protein A7P96_06855 [Eikenella sp. NML03-A-027]|uniref:MFS transporter n=1 Tax=Eikenella exigua TaxID=2528037 RepID=A0AAX1F759_9NEIS|nr:MULTISPECIES: hypothetical protein [Eikenella]OAM28903.1 hypothetical protein A7P94_02535 [Eikenella sp. NML01-A-086]OAM30324.1 hypothetical protein A7P96_06855 [Eikenella sp. NML03-A-027]OAM40973.1 hypothetical protein A7Q02_06435 [Eikenella sp. NML97-A-109]QED91885.1 hypothetical protein EZJ17_04030 [Eikenella exigua]
MTDWVGRLLVLPVYILLSLFFKWILSWGGAEKIEGWKAGWLIGWVADDWDTEQIRMWALLTWIGWTVFCLLALVV